LPVSVAHYLIIFLLTSRKLYLDATIAIVGQARRKTAIDGSTNVARPLPAPTVTIDMASVKALAVVARIIISSAALSSTDDKVASSLVDAMIESARSTMASKHAIEASAKAISDVCC